MAASAGPRTEGPEAARESHGSKEKVPDGVRAGHRTMNNTLALRVTRTVPRIALSVKG